ncbi:hypothetical protein PENANT_c001G07925 [Penicillium antarcticum]|uniref:Major facilitator superfamily (MFS) profile domain-containing protein n=1 Tax=Penicillium antarcticum TaxID=416450 RepID=A0A1V6QNN9_9EURO|nr:hypothetical protein PENANT_c001G07925 [Penicillium antarcticum]
MSSTFFGAFLIRESPCWLFGRGRRHDAIENLCWVRQLSKTDVYIVEEIARIDQAFEEQAAWMVFTSLGNTGSLNQMMSGIFGVVEIVVRFCWLLFLIDPLGRLKLLIAGSIGGSVCMWVTGAYIKIKDPDYALFDKNEP